MSSTIIKKKKAKALPKGVAVFKQMLKDKKAISKHLHNGGTFKELKEKGYNFETV